MTSHPLGATYGCSFSQNGFKPEQEAYYDAMAELVPDDRCSLRFASNSS
jgi:hypothetical protein